MLLNRTIFKTYDIRGLAEPGKLDAPLAYCAGVGYVRHLQAKHNTAMPTVVVTRDGRVSSPELTGALITGMVDAGAQVTYGGLATTPMSYLINTHHPHHYLGAVQVSASHNPAAYNGFKVRDKDGKIWGEELQEVYHLACAVETVPSDFIGWEERCLHQDFTPWYQLLLQEVVGSMPRVSIVVDGSNAVAGLINPPVLRSMGVAVEELCCELDGTFPHHEPDPALAENYPDLMATVVAAGADWGVMYDGDGDRVGMVDSTGRLLHQSEMLCLLGYQMAQQKQQTGETARMVIDCMQAEGVASYLRSVGAEVFFCPTGHASVYEALYRYDADLAGELSAHIMYRDLHGHDDALYATCRLLQVLSSAPGLLEEIRSFMPATLQEKYYYLPCSDAHKGPVMQRVITALRAQYPDAITLDGVRVRLGDFTWGILRQSNTEPVLKLRVQSPEEPELERLLHHYMQACEAAYSAEGLPLPEVRQVA
ncbi:hypothetical protein H6771_01255 [Candidatus Peribacteria bacterium]|nr:hypothetical protein [Candidatus Peribacteria bacterium]